MKSLSIQNPWAELIRSGHKSIEVRSWNTSHRGDLLIVSSLAPDRELLRKTKKTDPYHGIYCQAANEADGKILNGYYHFGKAICLVELFDVTPFLPEHEPGSLVDYYPGLFAWHLRNFRSVEPFAVKGQLGFYNVPDELIKETTFEFL